MESRQCQAQKTLVFGIPRAEFESLEELAEREERSIERQAAYLIRQALRERAAEPRS